MERAKLLAAMAAMLVLMAAVIALSSEYAPPVGPVREIEEIWAIEDARSESETPLVTRLENGGVPLAYDAQEDTFYCPIGLVNDGDWPALHLTVPDAPGVTVCFSDDYAYDWCDEAVAEGYAYEMLTYDEETYHYFYIVFTGLPILSVQTQRALSTEDCGVTAVFSHAGEMLESAGEMHMRGNGTLEKYEKKSYKLSLTDGSGKKTEQEVPALGVTDEVILLSMVIDDTMMHDRLCWDLVSRMTPEGTAFAPKANGYVELFIDNAYAGVYLMLDPYDNAQEIARESEEAVLRDSLYRTAHGTSYRDGERAYADDPLIENMCYELFYTASPREPFAALEDYFALETLESDEEFAHRAPQTLDMRSFLTYDLLIQATGMHDTVHNNTYFWEHWQDGAYRYRVLPWDMDLSWGVDMGAQYDRWIPFNTVDRLLNLNAGGARQMMLEIWNEMKAAGFNAETIGMLTAQYAAELNDSGAAAREFYRWNRSAASVDGFHIVNYAQARFALMDQTLKAIAENPDEPIGFLETAEYKVYDAKIIHILGE